MASYDAAINLIVNGGSKIDRIIDKVAQLENIVGSLSKIPLEINIKAAQTQLDSFDATVKATKETIQNQEKNLNTAGKSIEKYSTQIASAQEQLSKLNPNTKRYNEILARQEDAIAGLAQAQKDLTAASTTLSKAQGKLNLDEQNASEAKSALILSEAIEQLAGDYLALGAAQKRSATGGILKNQPRSSISGLAAQAEALKLIADNSAIASSQFNRYSIATQMASQKIYEARQQQLKGLAFGLSAQGERVNIGTGQEKGIKASRELVRSLVASYADVAKSEAGLTAYLERLRAIQAIVPIVSNEHRLLEEAIAGVNQELSKVGLRGQTSKVSPVPTYGPAVELESVKAIQMQQKYSNDLVATREKLTRISVNLDGLAISQNEKDQARNRLAQAFNALQENNLDLARKLGTEADRYGRDARSRQIAAERVLRIEQNAQAADQRYAEKKSAAEAQALKTAKLIAGEAIVDNSDLDALVNSFLNAEKSAKSIVLDSKEALKNFQARLSARETPLATRLGGGAEVRARSQYETSLQVGRVLGPGNEQGINAVNQAKEKQSRLNGIIYSQELQTLNLLEKYSLAEKNNVDLTDKKAQLLQAINTIQSRNFDINEATVGIIGKMIKDYTLMLNLETNRAKAAGTFISTSTGRKVAGGKPEAEIIEERRNRLLMNALSLQGNMVSIEGKGGEIAAEKLQIEAKITQLKEMQNKASQADLKLLAQQIQELRIKAKEIANTVSSNPRQVPFLERQFGKPGGLLSRFPGSAQQKASAVQEGLVGGAFPLLFGQGIGASAGGLLGGVAGGLMGGGIGMGLSLLGTSIGGFLDQAVIKAKELGNLLLISGDNGNQLRQQGVFYTAELEKQVRLLKEQGQFAKASEVQRGAVTAQTGDIGTFNIKAAGAAANELEKAWKGFSSTFGNFFATAATPFVFAISVLLRGLQSALKVVNQITSGMSWLINNIPGIGPMIQKFSEYASEQAIKGTEEYENQLSEINKQIAANEKNNKILADKNNIIQGALGKSKVEFDLATKKAEAQQRVAELEKQIQEFRASAPTGTSELRIKAAIGESQLRRKFLEEERGIAISNAQSLFTEISESNKRIALQQKQYQREYADIVRQNTRTQNDLNLEVARKIQDIRMEMREKELQYTKQIADEELKAIKLANEERSFKRGINAAISGNPEDDIINTVQTAIENWRAGRREVEQEYAAKQREIQLQAQKAEIAIQRYKYDNALKIARANEESRVKINRMQEQINQQNDEVSRNEFTRKGKQIELEIALLQQKAKAEAFRLETQLTSLGQMMNPQQIELYSTQLGIQKSLEDFFGSLGKTFTKFIDEAKILKLSPVGPAPRLTDPSAPASAAMSDAQKQTEQYAKQIAYLEKIQGLKEKDLALAKAILDPNAQQLRQLNEIILSQVQSNNGKAMYRKLITMGTLPALAEEQQKIAQLAIPEINRINMFKKALMATDEYKSGAPQIVDMVEQLDVLRQNMTDRMNRALINAGEIFNPFQRATDEIIRLKGELSNLIDPVNQITQVAASIGDAFSESFRGVIDGSMTAQESLASFFKNTAKFFLDMAGQIISKMIQMAILNSVIGLLPGAKTASKGSAALLVPPTPGAPLMAANGAVLMNGIQPFARGGIVSSPTLFKFANGGALRTGLMGEAGPEAVMPLKRGPGGRLGVDASGSGSGVNVTVNVDATGTNVSGDNRQAGELGRAISAAVQQELVKQKRPGGLLA